MILQLDTQAALPLYHQIAQAIRYRIAIGSLTPGAELPPLREAGASWGVNLHTVRRAYRELAEKGLVETRAPFGTRVVEAPKTAGAAEAVRREFLNRIVDEARQVHGLSVDELHRFLGERCSEQPATPAIVYLVECSETQCEDLARQLESRYRLDARPWRLDRRGPPPDGVIVSTYFHYNDIRRQWPERFPDVHFVAIHPDPAIGAELEASAGPERPIEVLLCEREQTMADNIAADLSRTLPGHLFRLATRTIDEPASLLGEAEQSLLLFAPRVWGELNEEERAHVRVHELRYIFESKSLNALAGELAWETRR